MADPRELDENLQQLLHSPSYRVAYKDMDFLDRPELRPVRMQLNNTIDADCGQAVMVGLPESLFLRLVLRFYLLPLLAGLVGGLAGHYLAVRFGAGLALSDLLTLAFAVLGGLLAVWKNRAIQSEFSEIPAVHLLRTVGERETKEEVCL